MNPTCLLPATILGLSAAWPACATVPLDGYLVAGTDCPAYTSIKKKSNPGDVKLAAGQAYTVVGKNRSAASHYLLRMEQADPARRWVEVSCGMLLTGCTRSGGIGPSATADNDAGSGPGDTAATGAPLLLAVSWQPAFCQNHPTKDECEAQTADRYDATHFTLHGLWPQPEDNSYCGVSNLDKRLDRDGDWGRLPQLPLSDATRADLTVAMPGAASFLQRHEWYKHGSCYGPPEEYFKDALQLMDQLNQSAVRTLFATNIGKTLGARRIRDAFDQAFGDGSGNKVQVKCSDGMVSELYINLGGDIEADTELADLLAAGADTGPGCSDGRVDAVGF